MKPGKVIGQFERGDLLTIDYNALIQFINSLKGQYAFTIFKRKPFLIETASNGFFYTPESTGKTRFHDYNTLRKIVTIFNNSGSLHPGDYVDVSMNSSYSLALIKMYIEQQGQD